MIIVLTILALTLFALGFSHIVINAVFEATRVAGSESRRHVAAMLVVWSVVEIGVSAAIVALSFGVRV